MPGKETVTTSISHEQRHAALVKWVVLIGFVTSAVTSGLFVLLYSQTGAWQMLVIAGLAILAIACLAVAGWLVHRGEPESAGYWVLFAVLVAYGGSELVLAGATLHLTVSGILVILLLGRVVLPRKRGTWLVIIGLFGAYIWLVNRFEPLPRYDMTQSAVLRLYIIPATTALVVLMVLWQFVFAYRRIETIGSRLLTAFVLMVLLPAAIISALSGVVGLQSGQQQMINQLESVATLKEAEIRMWVSRLQTNLGLALREHQVPWLEVLLQESPAPADYQEAYDKLQEHFAQVIEETQLFEEVFLMNRQGRVVLSTDATQESKIHSNQMYFWEGLEGAHVHPPFYSPSLGRMSVVVVRPVVDQQGHTLGVMAGRASMATLNEIMLERAGLGETGETYLVGSNHVLLTGSRFVVQNEGAGTYVRTESANAALEAHANGSGLYDDYRGVPVAGVYRWLPELQVALLAEQDQSEAFRSTYATLGVNAGVAAIAVLAAIVAALFITRSIAAPLANLAETAAQIAAGDLELVAEVEREDEVSTLARAFNSMTAQLRGLISNLEQRVVDLKRAEEALRKSRSFLQSVIDGNPDLMMVIDRDYRILLANQAIRNTIEGKDPVSNCLACHQVSHHRDIPCEGMDDPCPLEHVIATKVPVTFTHTHYDAESHAIYVEVSAAPIFGEAGEVVQIIESCRDVTERVQAQEALRESEERYRDLFENANDLYQSVRPDGSFVYVNRAWRETLGYSEEEIPGLCLFDIIHPDNKALCMKMFHRVLTGEEFDRIEVVFVTKDGRAVAVEGSVNCRFKNGKPVATRGIFRDVTEHRQLETQLRQMQKMEAIGQLAAGIAHDFNNLLTPIGGFADLLLWEASEGSQQQEYLHTIKIAARRAAALTGQLRLFARQEKGKRRSVQLNSVVEETHALLERSIPKEITIELHLTSGLWAVEADPSQISQVLVNLCVNARDAMPDGGTLTLETRNVTLDEEWARAILEAQPERYVRLSVTDTGSGMSPEVQARLFEPFFTTKEVGEGTGLGLSVVYGIVKGHGGFINVYSEGGRGSTFHVYLPAIEVAVEEREVEGLELPTGTETILVVDDEEAVRALGQAVLERCGYTVLMAENGLQALEVYQAHRGEIPLVVLDVIMPQMGGRECLRRLRELDPQVKVLISTGYTFKGLAQELVAEGAWGVVEKPFQIRDFATAVRAALDKL